MALTDTEIRRLIDEEYRMYRQSGLGLVAILITLAGFMLKWSSSLAHHVQWHHRCLVLAQVILLAGGIAVSVGVQFCHYIGYRDQARKYYPAPGEDPAALQDTANRRFRLADRLVIAALAVTGLGAAISLMLWYTLLATAVPNIPDSP